MNVKAAAQAILIDPLKNADGSANVVRISIALGVAVYLGLSIYTVLQTRTFNFESFGIGFGALVTGYGAGSFMHAKSGQ